MQGQDKQVKQQQKQQQQQKLQQQNNLAAKGQSNIDPEFLQSKVTTITPPIDAKKQVEVKMEIEPEQKKESSKEQQIKQKLIEYLSAHKRQMSEGQMHQFIKKQIALNRSFQPNNLQQWIKQKKQLTQSQKDIQIVKVLPSKKNKPEKQQNTKLASQHNINNSKQVQQIVQNKQQLQVDIINHFLSTTKSQDSKQIKFKILNEFNEKISSKLFISSQTLHKYLSTIIPQNRSQLNFKEWLVKEQQSEITSLLKSFNQTSVAKEISNNTKKLQQIISLTNSSKSNLAINLGVGQTKGKTSLKYGIQLKQMTAKKFGIQIEIKIKKKSELRQFLQLHLKNIFKANQYNVMKLSKIHFSQLQKSLKIQIHSSIFQDYILKEIIQIIQKKFKQPEKPVLKVEGQFIFKNSIRSDQNNIQNKKFVKWTAQGLSKTIKIQGNSKLIQHFTTPFSQLFPIFKVIKSGEISLKLKKSENIDALFDKLGINEICEQTPSLHDYMAVLVQEYLDHSTLPWIGDLLKRALVFACNIPNERISAEVNINISHLNLNFLIASEACKQLGQLISKTTVQQFS